VIPVDDLVDVLRGDLERRGFEPVDEEELPGVLVLDDVQLKVEEPDEPWVGARLVMLVGSALPDDPRVHVVVAQAGEGLPSTVRCYVSPDEGVLAVWMEASVGPDAAVQVAAVLDEALEAAARLAKAIDQALDGPPRWVEATLQRTDGTLRDESGPGRSLEQVLDALDQMVGLETVRQQIGELVGNRQVAELRRQHGLKTEELSPHLVFTGNPGTGKTTVARIIGEIYAAIGLLPKGHVVEVDRAQLVGRYVGQTAPRTWKAVDRAMGGILFVDEAYSLTSAGSSEDFGSEAIETLMTAMENRRGQFALIVAGYPREMAAFLASNPGLESRFDATIHFRDYTTAELIEIFERRASHLDYDLDTGFAERLRVVLDAMERGRTFANGRTVRRLFHRVRARQEQRLLAAGEFAATDLRLLKPEDIPDRPPSTRWVSPAGYL
jgi:hypothetical protein